MNPSTLIRLLNQHGIFTFTRDSRVFALSISFNVHTRRTDRQWVNVTAWTYGQLMEWLGY